MIKFFRSIRHKLVLEGSVSKYLAYAAGEIVLVVIGILIALQINDANEQRLERKKELQYLSSLGNDLEINVQELPRQGTGTRTPGCPLALVSEKQALKGPGTINTDYADLNGTHDAECLPLDYPDNNMNPGRTDEESS